MESKKNNTFAPCFQQTCGVTVAQQILVLLVGVRIPAGLLDKLPIL